MKLLRRAYDMLFGQPDLSEEMKVKPDLDDLLKGKCPDCGHTEFYQGPHGGMCTNVKCTNCGSCFNMCYPIFSERIPDNGCYSEKRKIKPKDLE